MKNVVLITGGSGGIGRALCTRFCSEGWNVHFTGRSVEKGEETLNFLKTIHDEVRFHRSDSSVPEDAASVVEAILRMHGKIDCLVGNAGITDKGHRPHSELPMDVFREIIDINLFGTYTVCKEVIRGMSSRRRGNIIIVTSLLGQRGFAVRGDLPYGVSKAALEALCEYLAVECRDFGINVNTIYPGVKVATGFFDYLDAEERAKLAGPAILNDLAFRLASLDPGELTGKSISYQAFSKTPDLSSFNAEAGTVNKS